MKILVTSEVFGYGPITTGLNVVRELKKYNAVIMTFIGTGIALEQAKMSNYFANIIECKTYDFAELEKFKNTFLENDIILSSENINGARFALKIGMKNVYYMDNLMWMWDKIEDGMENLKGYIISETIPCRENFKRIGSKIKRPIFVGPIRDMENRSSGKIENKLIINIGGAEAFLINSMLVRTFYNKLINELLVNDQLVSKFDKIIICGGSGVINSLLLDKPSEKVIIKTLANEEYLAELDTCSHCIMASGLGNFFETLWRNKNIMYLPPVNYSQLLQIEYYEKMNLGYKLVNWNMFDFYEKIPSLLNEEAGVELVLENVNNYIKKGSNNIISKSVNDFLNQDQSIYFNSRMEYIKSLEKDASKKIASIIYNENKEA